MNSFKTRNAIFGSPLSPPDAQTFSLIGYSKVFGNAHVFTYFANSLIVTLGSMALVLLFGAMAAWALTEYRFRGASRSRSIWRSGSWCRSGSARSRSSP